MKILTVIPCHNSDCIRAERLIDQIFALNRKESKGHLLLVFAPTVPQENRDKIRISGEVAFKSVSILHVTIPKEIENQAAIANNKMPIVANVMSQVAKYVAKHFHMPWLWLEPDSLPLKSDWMEQIEETYTNQPMRYMAGHMKQKSGENEVFSISRMGVYPNDASMDFEEATKLNMGFEYYVLSMSSKCRLFQNTQFEKPEDISKIRPDAALAHSDKRALLVDGIVELNTKEVEYFQSSNDIPVRVISEEIAPTHPDLKIPIIHESPKRRGRPPKIQPPATTVTA